MKDITHIERPSLPWRLEHATECGLDGTRHPTWTREVAAAKAQEMGRQRFSLFVCMTCFHTMERHSTWEEDPASCLLRHTTGMTARWGGDAAGEKKRFADELRAIAALIGAHRDDFDVLVRQLGEVVDIKEAQRRVKLLGKGTANA